ncbi:probable serine/threonine-protein kinase WNK9 [Spinacia oleracea]|uniref:non-specific serine/threonine protein kinase n=1 Tax=Spinacia oleracea TaxID=3562 RepID=A0A9R0I3X6_SPIOL|nr:probable serine/threonine-protein kinase WNK9 [Spinacia oleracea]
MSSSSVLQVAERDPTRQYVRYNEMLGKGLQKRVYKGFDEVNGIEIAWSVVVLKDKILNSASNLYHMIAEANMMKLLDHKNIVKCYHFWIDYSNSKIHLITEPFSSETLNHYIVKHVPVNHTSTKNWCRQILNGLNYLHTHDPPIAHRDVKLMNIFVDGDSGTVKLGDFGFAKLIETGSSLQGRYGTKLFMAPEIYRGNYNEMVDIHSFGMCVILMVTRVIPYIECKNKDEFYAKIKGSVKQNVLNKVTDPQIKEFLDMCLAPASARSSAIELLNHPFLAVVSQVESSMSQVELSMSQVTRAQVDRLLQLNQKLMMSEELLDYNLGNLFSENPSDVEYDDDDEVGLAVCDDEHDPIPTHEILIEQSFPSLSFFEFMGDEDESEAENNGMLSCLGKLLSSVCSNL